ncbi:PilZ domain-containing protein [Blastomonas sp.]|uniref:PilZ domain-containing protein n=1 Tax=Blastomonas sp. TaxID=1909299 RepID=UPI0035930DCB
MNQHVSPASLTEKEARDRDSLFLLADITFEGSDAVHKVKVRNLSPGGMMIESDLEVKTDQSIVAMLRNIGAVKGKIAWARNRRFGVAFDSLINPKLARQPLTVGEKTPRYLRTVFGTSPSFPRR